MFQGLVALRAAVGHRVSACAPIAEELLGVCEQLSESPSRTPMLDAALDDVLFRTSFVRDAAVASAASPAQAVAVVHRHRALVRRLLDSRLDRLDPSDLQVERTASKYRSASLVLDSFALRSPDSTADAPSEGTPFERVHTHVLEELRASEPRPRLARPMALAWATSVNRRSQVDSLFCERIAHDLLDVQPSMEAFLRFAGMWVDDEPLGSMLCSLHRLVRFVDASERSKKRPTLTELSDRLAGCARSTGAIRTHAVWASSLVGLEALASALREASASGSSLDLEDRLVAAIRAVQATSPHESSAPSRRHDPLLLARSVLLSTDLLEARLHDSRLLGREGWWRAIRSTRGARIPVRLLVLLLECFEVERELRRLEREERPSVPAPRRPTRIGPYEVLGHIGNPQETGMGECLRVKLVGQASNPERVMKRVKPGISQALFREEARAMLGLASANHPGIVRFLAFAEDVGESPYLVMELVPGPNLARRLAAGPASVLDAARCVERMADALACAHAHGIAHLDLKPANVILRHGEMSDAVIIDWGLAGTNGEWGSFGYVSPERLAAAQSVEYRSSRHWAGASDVFALGAILVELLSGANPLHTDACPLGPEERPAHLADFLDSIEDPGHRADLEQDLLLREPGLLDARVVRFLVGIPDALVQVARMCLVLDHRMRPSSRQVTEVLRHLAATDRRPAADRPF